MRPPRHLLVAGLAGAAALAIACACVSEPSERCWLAVPVALGAGFAAWHGRDDVRRAALACAAVATLLFVAACGLQLEVLGALGAGLSGVSPAEAAFDAWDGLALLLVATAAWWTVRAAVRASNARRGGAPDALLPQLAPPLLAFPIVAPVVIGSTLVHRPKIPDAVLPDRPYEDVVLTAADGTRLRAWYLPAPGGSARAVLMEHGIGANRSLSLAALPIPDRLHANTLLLDLRGHGESEGHTTSFGCHEWMDVQAGLRWLRGERPAEARQVVAVGMSLSTSATVLAAARVDPPFDAVILDSPFTAPVDMADGVLRHVPSLLRPLLIWPGIPWVSLEARCWLPGVRPVDAVAHVRAPIWIAHADGDPLIPVEQGRRMYAAAIEPKGWFEAHGAVHMASNADANGWLASMSAFFDAHLPPAE